MAQNPPQGLRSPSERRPRVRFRGHRAARREGVRQVPLPRRCIYRHSAHERARKEPFVGLEHGLVQPGHAWKDVDVLHLGEWDPAVGSGMHSAPWTKPEGGGDGGEVESGGDRKLSARAMGHSKWAEATTGAPMNTACNGDYFRLLLGQSHKVVMSCSCALACREGCHPHAGGIQLLALGLVMGPHLLHLRIASFDHSVLCYFGAAADTQKRGWSELDREQTAHRRRVDSQLQAECLCDRLMRRGAHGANRKWAAMVVGRLAESTCEQRPALCPPPGEHKRREEVGLTSYVMSSCVGPMPPDVKTNPSGPTKSLSFATLDEIVSRSSGIVSVRMRSTPREYRRRAAE